ncbi:hypothetical protein MGMO_41c00500 [Methyloglobulus morosus KoM1]|uniref:Uncharacterized protein n=1 Tax=Methyloglobulus morosus KoM1 TaxID=1116472 RepID=V5BI49_9GAMM|nr:hypothetical protein MGMO_41c00500 [Methyloglobulus morosus KoM1]
MALNVMVNRDSIVLRYIYFEAMAWTTAPNSVW